jgi:hypothetical protein
VTKAVLVVLTNPASPEREAEFNEWYDTVHVPDILALPGFTAATRYKASAPSGDAPSHLAIYEIDSDDPQATVAGIMAGMGEGKVRMGDVLGMSPPPSMVTYEEVTPRTTA